MSSLYVLDAQGSPVHEPDHVAWSRWFNAGERRRVAETELANGARVSTIFMGIDHRFGEGEPVLWETLVFDAPDGDDRQRRYTSREDALAGHAEVVAELEQTSAATTREGE